jgi:hypothetical protein
MMQLLAVPSRTIDFYTSFTNILSRVWVLYANLQNKNKRLAD